MTKRILSVEVKQEVDTDPDLSFLGEYSQVPKGNCYIDRKARGDQGRNEFRYFIPAMSGEETGNPNSPEEDYQRMEAYQRQEWGMIYVIAEAKIVLNNIVQTITSGGLWGIESDYDEGYFKEVAQEQLDDIRQELLAIGFTDDQITKAFDAKETSND